MLNFSDGFILNGIESIKKHPEHLDILRKKRFRVADTQLSYRQINSLEASDVIEDTRDTVNGWRLFSLKDLIYLIMIFECRKYGIQNEQLKELKRDFYTNKMSDDVIFKSDELIWGELAIFAAIVGNRVTWVLYSDGKSFFCDQVGMLYLQGWATPETTSHLQLNLNEVLRDVLQNSKNPLETQRFKEYPPLVDFKSYFTNMGLTEKQKELLRIIKDSDYTKITIMKGKDNYKVYGESTKEAGNLTEEELIKMLREKEFSNIRVQRRNGKIVSYSFEDVIKI